MNLCGMDDEEMNSLLLTWLLNRKPKIEDTISRGNKSEHISWVQG